MQHYAAATICGFGHALSDHGFGAFGQGATIAEWRAMEKSATGYQTAAVQWSRGPYFVGAIQHVGWTEPLGKAAHALTQLRARLAGLSADPSASAESTLRMHYNRWRNAIEEAKQYLWTASGGVTNSNIPMPPPTPEAVAVAPGEPAPKDEPDSGLRPPGMRIAGMGIIGIAALGLGALWFLKRRR